MCWCMIETSLHLPRKSLAIFDYLWKSLVISRNFWKCLESFVWPSDSTGESSEIFGKGSEIFGKLSETSLTVCLYNKQNNTWLLVGMEYLFSCATLLTLVRYTHS